MAMTRRSTASGLVGIALAAFLLSGCSADEKLTPLSEGGGSATSSPAPTDSTKKAGEQSTEEACQVLKDDVEETMSSISATDPTDPVAAAAAVTALSETFSATAATIDNAEVRAAADSAGAAFVGYGEALSTVAADPTQTDVAVAAQADLKTALGDLGEVCP
ncbi:MAG: hypothetical protein JWM51_1483 [Microbacteriaceae bacterium]|nr:hypothetical protein [Microbacteriaceae bacterium]